MCSCQVRFFPNGVGSQLDDPVQKLKYAVLLKVWVFPRHFWDLTVTYKYYLHYLYKLKLCHLYVRNKSGTTNCAGWRTVADSTKFERRSSKRAFQQSSRKNFKFEITFKVNGHSTWFSVDTSLRVQTWDKKA